MYVHHPSLSNELIVVYGFSSVRCNYFFFICRIIRRCRVKDIAYKTAAIIDDLWVFFFEKDTWRLSQKTFAFLEASRGSRSTTGQQSQAYYNQEMREVPEACRAYCFLHITYLGHPPVGLTGSVINSKRCKKALRSVRALSAN